MTKDNIIFAAIGGAIGFFVGYKLLEKKVKNDYKEKLDRVVETISSKEAPDEVSSDYNDIVSDLMYEATEEEIGAENDEDDTDISEDSEDEEETSDDYYEDDEVVIKPAPKKKSIRPKILGKTNLDPDDIYGNMNYGEEDVYYFMRSDILTDSKGEILPETDTIGSGLRRIGYMQGRGDPDIYVRNYSTEMDYYVHRLNETIGEHQFFPNEEQDE